MSGILQLSDAAITIAAIATIAMGIMIAVIRYKERKNKKE